MITLANNYLPSCVHLIINSTNLGTDLSVEEWNNDMAKVEQI